MGAGIKEWAARAGGAEVVWERGEGDARLVGYEAADGTRAIATNGDPVWSECEPDFGDYWLSLEDTGETGESR
jgi:hypothetical protein